MRCRPAARTRLAVRARMLIILGLLRCEWSAPLGHTTVPRLGHEGARWEGAGLGRSAPVRGEVGRSEWTRAGWGGVDQGGAVGGGRRV